LRERHRCHCEEPQATKQSPPARGSIRTEIALLSLAMTEIIGRWSDQEWMQRRSS
jgi:hypothetical protein